MGGGFQKATLEPRRGWLGTHLSPALPSRWNWTGFAAWSPGQAAAVGHYKPRVHRCGEGGGWLEPNLSRAPRLGRLPASARASGMALLPESGRALGPAGIVRSAPPAGSRGFDVAAPALVLRCCVHAVGLPHADRCNKG